LRSVMSVTGSTNLPLSVPARIALLIVLLAAATLRVGATSPQTSTQTNKPAFTDADAVGILEQLQQSLESNRRSRFLKLFDARRMPNYAALRDAVTALFDNYDSFQAQYHLTQVRMDGEFGALVADFVLEAAAPNANAPNIRRSVQIRLVCAWDAKGWKIVDLSPRSLFE
jgi:hypothetical protein